MAIRTVASMLAAMTVGLAVGTAGAQVAEAPPDRLALDFNKLEQTGKGCLATFVIGNGFPAPVQWLDLRLVLFDPQGVVLEHLQVSFGPLPAGRRTLASFYLGEQSCAAVGSVLLAEVPNCTGVAAPGSCIAALAISNKTDIPFGP
jgi:hypothetical protein